jgi:hypothetical protein
MAARVNATRHGLLGGLPVLAGLGETVEMWNDHRAAVLRDLGAVGQLQIALGERVALLLWKLARAAKADVAAVAVSFQSAAAVEPPPDDPVFPDRGAWRVRELRRQLAVARSRAAAYHRAVELSDRLADAPDDEAIDPVMAEAMWAAALSALNRDPAFSGDHLARQLLEKEGVSGPALSVGRLFQDWTVRRLRAGLAGLADGKGPVGELVGALPNWLRHAAKEQDRQVRELKAGVAVAEGERVIARVEPALEKAAAAMPALELVARYEGVQSRELARTLAHFFTLREAMPASDRAESDGLETERSG